MTLSLKPTPDMLIYASANRGFKSGGFNGRANSLADLTLVVTSALSLLTRFAPETVWTNEGGAKRSFMDCRIRLSLAGFWGD